LRRCWAVAAPAIDQHSSVPELTPHGGVKLNSGNRLHVTLSPLGFAVAGHTAQVRHALRSRRAERPTFDGSAASFRVAFEMDKQKHDLIYQIATAGLVVAFFVLMLFLRR
jgi:2'-5' RNA ligase